MRLLRPAAWSVAWLLAAASASAGGFSDATTRELARALACVNLSLDDLGWQKRPIDDDFRLRCVNETLDHPLQLANRAEQAESDFTQPPAATLLAERAWLDVSPDTTAGASKEPSATPSDGGQADSREHRQGRAMDAAETLGRTLARDLSDARAHVTASLAPLSPTERALVRKALPRLYVDDSLEDEGFGPLLAAVKKVDRRELAHAAVAVARALDDIDRLVPAVQALAAPPAGAKSAKPRASKTRRVMEQGLSIVLGGTGNDTIQDADVVVDLGGNDTYTRCAFVVDLGGDDTYRDCGSGLLGAGLVEDFAGNDRYLGGRFTEGGAGLGVSVLVDRAGDDRYEADQLSQGAAFLGYGLLVDLAGDDGYRGARFVQGFGGVLGIGVLSDRAGNDTYYAGGKYSHAPLLPENFQSLSQGFGFGLRPDASGGVGVLVDSAGNDIYSAEVFGQGASYWFSLGILVDSAGHDKYDLYQYGQGAGIHLSAGVLMDRAGNDAYSCNNGVAQGSGHDWGTGLLWDRAGDDYYQGAGMSQGGANANAIGMLVDEAGDDGYSGVHDPNKNQGDAFFSRGTLGLGVLLDMAGKDHYSHGGADGATWTRGTVGVGRDVPDAPPAAPGGKP